MVRTGAEYMNSDKNMNFLVKILKELNINYTDLARAAGVTPQLVAYWIDHDDIKLSRLISAMKALNIKIECHFQKIQESNTIELSDNIYDLQMYNVHRYKKELPGTGFVIENAIASNARLKFLAELVKEMNLSLIDFSEEVDRKYQSMHHCFKVDDIKISIIYDIARKTGRRVRWRLSPLKEDEENQRQDREVSVEDREG